MIQNVQLKGIINKYTMDSWIFFSTRTALTIQCWHCECHKDFNLSNNLKQT